MQFQNQSPSGHRYKTLQDFVAEQGRYLALEKQASDQSALDRERTDVAIRNSLVDSSKTRSTGARDSVDSRRRPSSSASKRARSSQILPNGLTVETINVSRDEREAKARAKANSRTRKLSSQSPSDRKSFAPSLLSLQTGMIASENEELSESPSIPWLQDQRRRFSSPLLTNKMRNMSSDNIAPLRSRRNLGAGKGPGTSVTDLRMSTQSMVVPPRGGGSSGKALRSPSPSRQSFHTTGTGGMSHRESRGWRKSLWGRSTSASGASVLHSGSMMEMHLGMSQDRHNPIPLSAGSLYSPTTGQTQVWPDTASAVEDSSGISPDERFSGPEIEKKKKKGLKRFFSSLIGGQASDRQDVPKSQSERKQLDRRESGLSYSAAAAVGSGYPDDSEPLAPPPPLSFLTGQQPHRRSASSSSVTSVGPIPQGTADTAGSVARPASLAVPVAGLVASNNGYISPSTSSSDLNRNRPSSVTSWRSSSKTGSPQSPREMGLTDTFGMSMPAIRQSSMDDFPNVAGARASRSAMPLTASMGIEVIKAHELFPSDMAQLSLRREKSLPALPAQDTEDMAFGLQQPVPPRDYNAQHPSANPASFYGGPGHSSAQQVYSAYPHQSNSGRDSYSQSVYSVGGRNGEAWNTGTEYYGDAESIKPKKTKSRLFGFGGKKSRKNPESPPPALPSTQDQRQRMTSYERDYIPREAALEAVVRDNPAEMVAYRYAQLPCALRKPTDDFLGSDIHL